VTPADLPVPDFGGGSLADVLPAVLQGFGVPGEHSGMDLPVNGRVCLLLIDGLGALALAAAAEAAPFLSSLRELPHSRTITSVFPSTTPIALTSLGTGLPPGEHGVTGLFVRRPEDGRLVNTLAIPSDVDMRAFQSRRTAFERAVAAGVTVTRVGPKAFDGQGLSEAGLRGGDYAGAEGMGELVDETVRAAARSDRSLTYAYVSHLDATGHRRGCRSAAWLAELTHVDRVAEQLADSLPAGVTLVVTSDHGMVDVPFDNRRDVATTPELAAGVETVAGDLRGVHVHAVPGASPDVLEAWRSTLLDEFWVLERDEAISAGLFGPTVADHVRGRIGDVVAAARGDSAVADSRHVPAAILGLIGLHGSVTPEELLVPLLVRG
jgi:type I phosphodiesterase/nucleotide pyrophosphatase